MVFILGLRRDNSLIKQRTLVIAKLNKPKRKVVQGARIKIIPRHRKEVDLGHLVVVLIMMMDEKEQERKYRDKAA